MSVSRAAHTRSRAARLTQTRLATTTAVATAITLVAASASAQYSSDKVSMYDQITVSGFGTGADNGNDCWGYVSASGREYALMGISNALAVVEVTDPANPVVVDTVSHTNSLWGDVKVYQDYAYFVNESGGGIDVIDLSDVDNGTVSLVRRVTSDGLRTSHNVVVNTDTGYLYTVGSNIYGGGLVAYDLSTPSNPVRVGQWTGSYIHDAQVVRYPDGREIAFCFCGENGLYIVDASNKNSMSTIKRVTYSGLSYCHQGWADEELNYLYVDDELDEYYGYEPTTRTIIVDISDLPNSAYAGEFTTGLPSSDHNLYVKGDYIFEANYTSGVRIFDASDRLNPVEAGWFDTYPSNNSVGFNGNWNVYPYLPSGTVLASDMQRGLFILDASEAVDDMRLSVDPLFAGQMANLYVTGATASGPVYFVYSLAGTGSTYLAALNVTLDLANPVLAGSDTADVNGDATLSKMVPNAAKNKLVWIQACEYQGKTNVVNEQVN
ncbi:MAG: choice-of-anchor B family protein [Planctomycetes bacterium]|nr:choice-of-anchor B family protein [Planctomycetota bacterium]NOG54940.1 choice-of-anchor B family protein [Planctomycetota bacterium]